MIDDLFFFTLKASTIVIAICVAGMAVSKLINI